tara:strand:- start:31 stop:624 length:594 start_codon:yes stop_codon:yes gene_type:complete
MFTGIIKDIGEIVAIRKEKDNLHISCKTSLIKEVNIDQSIAHNGVCLTVIDIDIDKKFYTVTVIQETLDKTNLGLLAVGDKINLELCMEIKSRFDGHIVQGHVDQIAKCTKISTLNGSYLFSFEYKHSENITVEKGSICINGVSLTVIDSKINTFSVAVIPYTYENTNFHEFEIGTIVNLEFDIIGKYINKFLSTKK